ncbi:MAG TPA: AraC family transcriptional regulator [Chitinophagales bacterium]|nr:AraC family transcriptional regulator [Chitinophagales bacterium]
MLQNMASKSCIKLIELFFTHKDGVHVKTVFLGEANLVFDSNKITEKEIALCFQQLGFNVINDPEVEIVEKIKVAAIELIYYANNTNSLIRNSDYISERVQLPYERISKVFSKITNTTLEKYIILLKIEKAKELLLKNDFTLSEISYMLGYSSVHYLSNQFKKVTGFSVSQYKGLEDPHRIPLENLLDNIF